MKASKGLLLAAGIIGIVNAVSMLLGMLLASLILGASGLFSTGQGILGILYNQGIIPENEVIAMFVGGEESIVINLVTGGFYFALAAFLVSYGIVAFAVLLVAGILALVARKKEKKGAYIAAIVLAGIAFVFFNSGMLSTVSTVLAIIGAILGIKNCKKAELPEGELPMEEASEVAE